MRSVTNRCFSRPVRDFQRSRVYKGENAALIIAEGPKGQKGVGKLAERLDTVGEIQAWMDEITASDWFRSYLIPVNEAELSDYLTPRHSHYRIDVRDGRGRWCAGGCSSGFITMPRWSRKRLVILHEVGHVIVKSKPFHGKAFVRCVLDLVHQFVSPEDAEMLRMCYEERKVQYIDCGYQEELEVRCSPLEGEERERVKAMLSIPIDPRKKEAYSPPVNAGSGSLESALNPNERYVKVPEDRLKDSH